MMSLHMGAAGSVAGGKAMAVYLLEQQIPTEAMRAAATDRHLASRTPLPPAMELPHYCVTISIMPWQKRLA
jgi:hypothetical protein